MRRVNKRLGVELKRGLIRFCDINTTPTDLGDLCTEHGQHSYAAKAHGSGILFNPFV